MVRRTAPPTVASAAAPLAFGTIRVTARAAELRDDSAEFRSREVERSLDLRPARSLAVSARVELKSYDDADFSPWDGEVNVAWLPGDHHRVDVAAARLLVGDNVAAIEHRLIGTFGSIGVTERLTSRLSTAVSVDATRWSEDNTRLRVQGDTAVRVRGRRRRDDRVADDLSALLARRSSSGSSRRASTWRRAQR